MKNENIHFDEKRMYIFSELVKRHWRGELKSTEDLDELTEDIKKKYNFPDSELPFIKDHIRIAMGQNPNGEESFGNELDIIKK